MLQETCYKKHRSSAKQWDSTIINNVANDPDIDITVCLIKKADDCFLM